MKTNLKMLIGMLLLLSFMACQKEKGVEVNSVAKDFMSQPDGLVTLKSGAVVKKQGSNFLWQGDIVLSQDQLKVLDETGDIFTKDPIEEQKKSKVHPVYNMPFTTGDNNQAIPRAFGIYPTPYNMWAMVRFVYSPTLTSDRKIIIQQALRHWERNTNVRFYNATGQPTVDPTWGFEYPYIEFVNSTFNRSPVGRIGGRQQLELAAFQDSSVAIHEIGHAIGMLHEQSAFNRDDYINLNLSNVPVDNRHNFDKRTSNYFAVGSVDFNSVMMYGSYDFAINPSIPVMTRKSDGTTWSGGNALTNSDRSWANNIYIPYIARSDVYAELPDRVYKPDNTIMTPSERLSFQASLNNGNPYPPNCCRLPNNF
ncbi:M12 family metallopeptidase [Sphingobacterium sp.]|uniref:M12 family metallopeptidase n=1 Tax=Sphingobacterium sp. TaxID=341027 RepID=UPI0028994954|nr:M12 family metallopeptidase [Sphingobacterium sp.]